MPTLRMRFPGGRYHATPWGHHVNEGQIEWPPSPWRLLRALLACGFNTQGWSDVSSLPPVARHLIEKLAGVLPSYRLPTATAAHSRHFMPVGVLDKGREKTTLVFDIWADLGDDVIEIQWPCELTVDESELLGELAKCLGYLGRSESWVEAELIVDATDKGFQAMPHVEGLHAGRGWEQITLMAAIPSTDYESWREKEASEVTKTIPQPAGKNNRKPTATQLRDFEKKVATAVAPYPDDILACLTKDTAWWKSHRWNQPPGSQRVVYWRRANSLEVGIPTQSVRRSEKRVTTMLLAITTPSGNRSALPLVTRTLPQAELFHRAIVGRVGNGREVDCPELTGKDANGKPLTNGHQHAHVIPLSLRDAEAGQRRIDHMLIHSPMGLGDAAQRAIRTMRKTWTKGGAGDLQVAVAACGDIKMLRSLPQPFSHSISRLLGPEKGCSVWISSTPFVPARFLKKSGENSLVGQINAELRWRGLPETEAVSILEDETKEFRHFTITRQRAGNQPPQKLGIALCLKFAEPLNSSQAPLTLGYGSHFGLGLFRAEPESSVAR